MMNPEIKKDWVEALRSGEYAQGKCSLRTDDEFCCLGVLSDLYCKATGYSPSVKIAHRDGPTGALAKQYSYFDIVGTLPEAVADWAGLQDNPRPRTILISGKRTLAAANDSGVSFETIASIIDREL